MCYFIFKVQVFTISRFNGQSFLVLSKTKQNSVPVDDVSLLGSWILLFHVLFIYHVPFIDFHFHLLVHTVWLSVTKPELNKSAYIHSVCNTQICLNFSSSFHFIMKTSLGGFFFLIWFYRKQENILNFYPQRSLFLNLLSVHDVLMGQ